MARTTKPKTAKPAVPVPHHASWDGSGWALPLLAAAAALAVTLPGLFGGFVWDDRILILQSPLRAHPEFFWKSLLGGHGLGTFLRPEDQTSYYRPLGNLLHGLLLLIFGAAPLPFRLANSLLHAGSACLLGLLLRRHAPRSAWAAVAFAVHPALADAHAWISAAPDLLATLLILAMLLALDRPRPRLVLVALLAFLALASKESAVSGLIWAPLFFLWRQAGRESQGATLLRQARRPLLGLGLGSAAYIALRLAGPGFHFSVASHPPGVVASGLVLVGRVFLIDMGTLLIPLRLTLSPPSWVVAGTNGWTGIMGVVLAAGLAAWSTTELARRLTSPSSGPGDAVRRPDLRSHLALASFLCLTALLPVAQIVPTGDIFGGRFLYLPAAGLCLGLGLAPWSIRARRWGRAVAAAGILLLTLGAVRTAQRVSEWGDEEKLFGAEYRRMPEGIHGAQNWASYLLSHGRTGEAQPVVEALYRRFPEDPGIESLMAGLWLGEDKLDQAERIFLGLYRTSPHTPPLLANLASCQIRMGKLTEGLATLDEAAGLGGLTPGMRNNRGLALERLGRVDEARAEYERASTEDPGYEAARVNLLRVLVRTGRDPEQARRQAEEFLRLFPGSPHAGTVRGFLQALAGR